MTPEEIADLPFREMLAALHVSQADLNRRWGIPLRTMGHWVNGDRQCPPYLQRMIVDLLYQAEG